MKIKHRHFETNNSDVHHIDTGKTNNLEFRRISDNIIQIIIKEIDEMTYTIDELFDIDMVSYEEALNVTERIMRNSFAMYKSTVLYDDEVADYAKEMDLRFTIDGKIDENSI